MNDFRISRLSNSSILLLWTEKDFIQLSPDYQRISDVWTLEKKQLLIDSIINGFDLPKFYFHEFVPLKKIDGSPKKYSIIDGKQRLTAIWDFIDGKFPLDDEFEYYADKSLKIGGMSYQDLADKHPIVKIKFDSYSLDITTIQVKEIDIIEEMFYRLNEAVPLNASEKRNSFSGPIVETVRNLIKHDFFTQRVPFENGRYRYNDLAVKFLYLVYMGKIGDTKKTQLDQFVENQAAIGAQASWEYVKARVISVLDMMAGVFVDDDILLRQVGMIVLYFLVFDYCLSKQIHSIPTRDQLLSFDQERARNRIMPPSHESFNYGLYEFDMYSQRISDGYALKTRYDTLRKFLGLIPHDEPV